MSVAAARQRRPRRGRWNKTASEEARAQDPVVLGLCGGAGHADFVSLSVQTLLPSGTSPTAIWQGPETQALWCGCGVGGVGAASGMGL